MSDSQHQPHLGALQTLAEAGHWERVLELAGPMLAESPNSAELHSLAGQAALQLDQHRQAKSHLTTCLALAPDDTWPHRLMAEMYTKENRVLYAKRHLETALAMDPEDGHTWLQFGWNCARRADWISAREAASCARQLLPENAGVASLEARANARSDGEESTKGDAFAQLDELRRALELDPTDDFVHFQMGEIYFELLGDLDNAEECQRTALSLDPSDKAYRSALFRTLRRRDPLLKFLYGPMHWYEQASARDSPAVVLAGFAVGTTAPFLLVPAKLYEYLVLAELRRETGQVRFDERGFARAFRWPFYVRFAAFLCLSALFVAGLLWFLLSPGLAPYRGEILSGAFLIFMIVCFAMSGKRSFQE